MMHSLWNTILFYTIFLCCTLILTLSMRSWHGTHTHTHTHTLLPVIKIIYYWRGSCAPLISICFQISPRQNEQLIAFSLCSHLSWTAVVFIELYSFIRDGRQNNKLITDNRRRSRKVSHNNCQQNHVLICKTCGCVWFDFYVVQIEKSEQMRAMTGFCRYLS